MDNIELVIKMPENDYKAYINHENYNEGRFVRLLTSVINGTLLPKEHGDLIDISKLPVTTTYFGTSDKPTEVVKYNCILNAKKIIKTNKAENEG